MHIAFLIERFEAAGGGLEHAAWQTARALVEAGDRVSVGCRSADGDAAANGIRTQTFSVPTFWQPLRIRRYAMLARSWLDEARNDRGANPIDVSHAWSRVPGADLFHSGEGSHADFMLRTYGRGGAIARRASPRHIAQLSLERDVYTHSDVTAQCVSRGVADELHARFRLAPGRTPVIGYGVDTDRFRPCDENERLRARRDLGGSSVEPETPIFAFVGSGWRRKGLGTAIEALAAARDRRAELWVAGRDAPLPWQQLAARHGVGERVRFLGPRSDIERIYAACDAWLLPTRYDAFGLVGLEAAACGLPGIVSAAAGVTDVVAEAARVIADAEDTVGFAEALDAFGDRSERERLGARGTAIAAENTWRAKTEELRALYKQVAAR